MFLDEAYLKISSQNLYTAHEIAQMKPLWDRDKTYSRLIEANRWIKKYLPNWQPRNVNSKLKIVNRKKIHLPFTIHNSQVESFLKNFQFWYMRKRISTERIGEHQLFFHPANTQELVLAEYRKRIKKLKIAL